MLEETNRVNDSRILNTNVDETLPELRNNIAEKVNDKQKSNV